MLSVCLILQWEDQHDTLSCVGFAEWKRNNDPNFQKEGLAAHLQANGIGNASSLLSFSSSSVLYINSTVTTAVTVLLCGE